MKWNLTVILTVLVAVVSYGLYQLSYEVQQLGSDLKQLQSGIKDNKETIQVLKAEWAYENRPEVLQALAAKHLPLLLVAPYQVAEMSDLPSRSTDAFAEQTRSIPIPRSKPHRRSAAITLPVGNLHMATYSMERQTPRAVE